MRVIEAFESLDHQIEDLNILKIYGKVSAVKGIIIECSGLADFMAIGGRCLIEKKVSLAQGSHQQNNKLMCEVVGFKDQTVILMPFGDTDGISVGSMVEICDHDNYIKPDSSWMGRVINAFGDPIDGLMPLKKGSLPYFLKKTPINSQNRNTLGPKIELGIKSIDLFTTCCLGQRMGIFAGSGVGKSVLISMLTKFSDFDVKVIGLIGERSREVKEFIDEYLGKEGLKNAIIIVATGDEPALVRKRAAYLTMAVAEYFRDEGKEVLCIIDSITRFAMAQREIGLAIGEPPTTKGYTPSVFSELPKLLERAGPGEAKTSITGLFTVLVEGDDHNEPISDAVRGILDGHIVLDREIAQRGRYPAVNILKSVSRSMPKCNSEIENKMLVQARKMLSIYNDMSELIRIGAYKKGTDPEVDMAIKCYNELEHFLTQSPDDHSYMNDSYVALEKILNSIKI
jgi:flagellum-specific ATP synthase